MRTSIINDDIAKVSTSRASICFVLAFSYCEILRSSSKYCVAVGVSSFHMRGFLEYSVIVAYSTLYDRETTPPGKGLSKSVMNGSD